MSGLVDISLFPLLQARNIQEKKGNINRLEKPVLYYHLATRKYKEGKG